MRHARTTTTSAPSWLRKVATVGMLLSVAYFLLFLTTAVASGWLLHADSYGTSFFAYGVAMLVLSGGLVAAAICYLLRLDLPAAVLATAMYVPMLALTFHVVQIAEVNGWAGQTAATFGKTASTVWRDGLLGNGIPFALVLTLALTRFCSYDARVKRQARKQAKGKQGAKPQASDK